MMREMCTAWHPANTQVQSFCFVTEDRAHGTTHRLVELRGAKVTFLSHAQAQSFRQMVSLAITAESCISCSSLLQLLNHLYMTLSCSKAQCSVPINVLHVLPAPMDLEELGHNR